MFTENKIAKIGLLLFLSTEVMFFAGLLSAYWVLRAQLPVWPPVGQPRFPVGVTGVNTLVLLASAVTFFQAERSLQHNSKRPWVAWLVVTIAGGCLFLVVQGYEWARLLHFGLTTVRNIYGSLFYVVVGMHAVHVLTALIVVTVVLSRSGNYTSAHHTGVTLGRIYWTFVVLVWPVIYLTLYLL